MKKLLIILFMTLVFEANTQTSAGSLSGNATVCASSNSGTLSLTSYSGTIKRWEMAFSPSGPWIPLYFNGAVYSYQNLSADTWFRAVVQLPGYSENNSNVVGVSCTSVSSAGLLSAPGEVCSSAPVTLSVSAFTGSVMCWEYSNNAWISTHTIASSATPVVTYPMLTGGTEFRCRVKNGVCPEAVSASKFVNVTAPTVSGFLSGAQTVCAVANSGIVSINGATGSVVSWETSQAPGGPFYVVSGSAGLSALSFSNLTQTSWFRVSVQNGSCLVEQTVPVKVQVDQASAGGLISGTSFLCSGNNAAPLQLQMHYGNVLNWEKSHDGTNWSNISQNGVVLLPGSLSATTIYRAVSKNGVCAPAGSGSFTITVLQRPVSSFSVNDVCAKSLCTYSNLSQNAVSYLWSFGDGSGSMVMSPQHVYNNAGSYSVKLTATDAAGCIDSTRQNLSAFSLPVAGFLSSDTACSNEKLSFINTSNIASGSLTSVQWSFGDGVSMSGNSAVHSYQQAGTYLARVTVLSAAGCKDSVVKHITVHPRPHALFTSTYVCSGSAVNISNTSTISAGPLFSWWQSSSGANSTKSNPSFTYATAGVYSLTLIVSSSNNCSDTCQGAVVVHETPLLTLAAEDVCQNAVCAYSVSAVPAALPLTWHISFGDGQSSTFAQSAHTFKNPGSYQFKATAVSDSGCAAVTEKHIQVYPTPRALFTAADVCERDSVRFINLSSLSTGSLFFNWNGPGFNSLQSEPVHVFAGAGVAEVQLVAISNHACADTVVRQIRLHAKPVAGFVVNNLCEGFAASFTNTSVNSEGTVKRTHWDFGDNSSSLAESPVRQYLNSGKYDVMLFVENTFGCTDTVVQSLIVAEAPLADFGAMNVCENEEARFHNRSKVQSGTYRSSWDFGDGTTSSENFPHHYYDGSGEFRVNLYVESSEGCTDSVSKILKVYKKPDLHFIKDTIIEKGSEIRIRLSGASEFYWFPANSIDNPNSGNVVLNPAETTEYIITGIDEFGCINKDTMLVTVNEGFAVYPYNILTPDGNQLNDTWIIKNIGAYPNNRVSIFNSWNQEVFFAEQYQNQWDGRNMAGELLPDGTYYYVLLIDGMPAPVKGFVTLLRNQAGR